MKKFLSLLMLLTVAIPSLLATDFKKVTSVDELVPGANYIIAGTHSSGTYVLTDGATSLETNATLSGKFTTVTDDVITAPDEAAIFTLEQSGEYYKLKYNGSKVVGYLSANITSKNNVQIRNADTDYEKMVIDPTNTTSAIMSVAYLTAKSKNYNIFSMFYNVSNSVVSTGFKFYSAKQGAIPDLYKEYVPAAVADPEITVAEGTYFVGDKVNVTLSCKDADATIHYTTDGTEPTAETTTTVTSGTSIVLNPDAVGSVTIKAIAVKNGETSNVVTESVKVNPVANTVADYNALDLGTIVRFGCPLRISYANSKHIFAQDAAGNGIFMYSKNGIGAAANGKVIPANNLIGKVDSYNSNKQLDFTDYTLPALTDGEAINPITVQLGALNDSCLYKYVMIPDVTLTKGADVMLYNVNDATGFLVNEYGSDNWPEDVTGKTFNIYGIYVNMGDSKGLYFIDAKAVEATLESPTLDVAGGIYDTEQTVNITAADGAEVRYTTNDAADIKYGAVGTDYTVGNRVTIDKSCTLRVIAAKGDDFSEVVSAIYTMKTATPTITAEAVDGVYSNEEGKLEVTISCPEYSDNVTVAYSVNGVEDIFEGNSKVITINGTATIKATALYGAFDESDEATATFTWNNPNVIENATVTGDIVIADQTGSALWDTQVTKGTLTDVFGHVFNLSKSGSGNNMTINKNSNTFRMYKNTTVTFDAGDVKMTKIEVTKYSSSDAQTTAMEIEGWTVSEDLTTFICNDAEGSQTITFKPTATNAWSNIKITYKGKVHYDKVVDGAALIGMKKGKFYQVNVVLQGVEANGGVLYARTSAESAAPSKPKEGHTGFDSYEDGYKLSNYAQRDWVAINGLGLDYEGKEVETGFIASYDGETLTPVAAPAIGDAADVTNINTFSVANVFYGNYENTETLGMENDYRPFFVKAKVNEVANFVGKVTKDTSEEGGSFRLEGSGKCGVFEGKGVLLEAANGVTLSVSGDDYKEFKGVLVAETNNTLAQCGVKIVALSAPTTPTGVAALKADGKATVYGTEGAVVVNGADGKVMIFDAMGRMVKSVNAEGAATVAMPAGYYIVRTAGTAAKVIVK